MSASSNRRDDRAMVSWEPTKDDGYYEFYGSDERPNKLENALRNMAARGGDVGKRTGIVNGASKAPKKLPSTAQALDAQWAIVDSNRKAFQDASLAYHPLRQAYLAAKQAYEESVKSYTLMTEGN